MQAMSSIEDAKLFNSKEKSMKSLVGEDPKVVLPHGPTKNLVDEYLWHEPTVGVIASYTPTERDVLDHFGVFRAVDQVESFGQAVAVSCSAFNEVSKLGISYQEYYKSRNFFVISIQSVMCRNVIRANEKFICMGLIKKYRFRQMVTGGRIYKAPNDLDVAAFFKDYKASDFLSLSLEKPFVLTTEIDEIVTAGVEIINFAS